MKEAELHADCKMNVARKACVFLALMGKAQEWLVGLYYSLSNG